ncbi:MAG: hypothetical protein LWW76_01675 [Burkholderiales bacterium]|jgi:hypothetical protein|nr:hypothetical protein [Burkholderiales bacterium]
MAKNKQWQDPNGKHLRLYHSLLNSPAFVALKPSSKVLFFRMRMDLGATNNGDISATLSTLKHHGIKSAATLASALNELQTLGFISKTFQGGLSMGKRNCCLYRFTDIDCFEFPKKGIKAIKATSDYLGIKSIKEAQAMLKSKAAPIQKIKSPIQKSNRTDSKIEAYGQNTDSEIEVYRFLGHRKRKVKREAKYRYSPVNLGDCRIYRMADRFKN